MRLFALTVSCALLMGLLLACEPAAIPGGDESAGLVSPPTTVPQEAPTQPDVTPDPDPTENPNFVFIPTNTPRPTLIPEPAGVMEEEAALLAASDNEAGAIQSPASRAKQDANHFSQGYSTGAIVRAEVTAHRMIAPDFTVTWPDRIGNPPFHPKLDTVEQDSWWESQSWPADKYASWRRSTLQIKETYHGSLPQGYEITAPDFLSNQALDVGEEYILYINRYQAAEDELPDEQIVQRYNSEQLSALGGSAGTLHLEQNWVIEGDTAWRITRQHLLQLETSTPVLTAAKANGESIPVADLIKAIEAGVAGN